MIDSNDQIPHSSSGKTITVIPFMGYEEYSMVYNRVWSKRTMRNVVITGFLLLFICQGYYTGWPKIGAKEPPYFVIFLGLLLALGLPLIAYNRKKKDYAQLLDGKRIYNFMPEKICIYSDTLKSEIEWRRVSEVKEINNCIVILIGKAEYYITTKAFTDEQLKNFWNLINEIRIPLKIKREERE
jgi:hypothetical protein